jgi:hypothetical protein
MAVTAIGRSRSCCEHGRVGSSTTSGSKGSGGGRRQDGLHHAGKPLGERLHRELQRETSRRAVGWRDFLHAPRSPGRHRDLATPLQHRSATRIPGLQAARSRGLRARLRRARGVATPTGVAARARREINLELTFVSDHSTGADQKLLGVSPPKAEATGSNPVGRASRSRRASRGQLATSAAPRCARDCPTS